MPRVWYGVPSARPVAQAQACFDAWRALGYAVTATRKHPDLQLDRLMCLPKYPGLWMATNILALAVMSDDPECEIFVTGGDDVWPDPNRSADSLADEFVEHFGGTLGVMQPTGANPPGHARLCWSPWLGRAWCARAFGGRGPTEPAFWHYFGDRYLYLVAERLGLLWERPDVMHEHRNWKEQLRRRRPPHLITSAEKWQADSDLCDQLSCDGFPGAELAP